MPSLRIVIRKRCPVNAASFGHPIPSPLPRADSSLGHTTIASERNDKVRLSKGVVVLVVATTVREIENDPGQVSRVGQARVTFANEGRERQCRENRVDREVWGAREEKPVRFVVIGTSRIIITRY